MMDNTDPTRRYTIEVKGLVSNETVMLTAIDWTDTDKRIAVAQSLGSQKRQPITASPH